MTGTIRLYLRLVIVLYTFTISLFILLSIFEENKNSTLSDRNPQLYKSNDVVLPLRIVEPTGPPLCSGLVPSIVHYVWCGRRWFDFKHYLSLMAAIRSISPDQVYFHYEAEPERDQLYYHLWLDDLKRDIPFLTVRMLSNDERDVCSDNRGRALDIMRHFLSYEGGIWVGENSWLLNFPISIRQYNSFWSLSSDLTEGFLLLRSNFSSLDRKSLQTGPSSSCASLSQFYNIGNNREPNCLVVKGGRYTYFNPMDIWELNDPFGRIARKIFYGDEKLLRPIPSYNELVPNVGHMIWIGGGPMDFVFFLSVLSMLFVAKVERVLIHGEAPPHGRYWDQLSSMVNVGGRLLWIKRPVPYQIFQGPIEPWYRALMSDLIRVDIMIKYGGIYTDTDAIWVKPLSYEDRGFDAVASFDWIDWSFPYPDSVNFGISYGKRNAPFWRIFRDSMRTLHNDLHGYTGVMMPYKLLEKYPHLLRIDRHLQVICYKLKCHPTWVRNYHNESNNHATSHSIPNWHEDVNAFHWTHPNPPEFRNMSALQSGKGIFADIGRNVLTKAGLI